ncbi:MAG: hypothetical protein WDO15_06205 [Bacteroidota bacterium]
MDGDKVDIDNIGMTKINGNVSPDQTPIDELPGMTTSETYYGTVVRSQSRMIKVNFADNVSSTVKDGLMKAAESQEVVNFTFTTTEKGQFTIASVNDELMMVERGTEKAIFKPSIVSDETQANKFVDNIEVVCRWINALDLQNSSSIITKNSYSLKLFTSENNSYDTVKFKPVAKQEAINELYYKFADNTWKKPAILLKIKNTSGMRLYLLCRIPSHELRDYRGSCSPKQCLNQVRRNGLS